MPQLEPMSALFYNPALAQQNVMPSYGQYGCHIRLLGLKDLFVYDGLITLRSKLLTVEFR